MTPHELAQSIERLAQDEHAAAATVQASLSQERDPSRWPYIAQMALIAPRPGVIPTIAAQAGTWGLAVDRAPLLSQLLHYPTLIVDLSPYSSHDDLVARFGLTQHQLLTLADRGRVLLNLYEYESQKHQAFAKYIASPDIDKFIRHPNLRIHSVRREAFFNCIAISDDLRASAREEGARLFSEPIARVAAASTAELHDLFRSSDIPGALEVATEWYLYLKIFGASYPEIATWLASLETYLGRRTFRDTVVALKGLKSLLATPYTAAFGGFASYTPRHLEAIEAGANIIDAADLPHVNVDPTLAAGLRYLSDLLCTETDRVQSLEVPPRIEDEELRDFLQILEDNADIQQSALASVDAMRSSVGDDDKVLSSAEGWATSAKKIRRSFNVRRFAAWAAGLGAGGAAGYVFALLTGGDGSAYRCILATVGAVGGGVLEKRAEEFVLAKIIGTQKCQVVAKLDEFEKMRSKRRRGAG